jgi:hypothetical protein
MAAEEIEPLHLTRRRFLQASTALAGAATALRGLRQYDRLAARARGAEAVWPPRVAFCSSSPELTAEATAYLVRRLLAHSPPVVVALATQSWRGGDRAIDGTRALLIHQSLDLTQPGSVRDAMHMAAQATHLDGWRFDLSGATVDPRDPRLDIALEAATRMARRVIWIQLGHRSSWILPLAERAAANPWLRFVLDASPRALLSGMRSLENAMVTLLRLPNVALRLTTSRLFTPQGIEIMTLTGPDRLAWGIRDLTFRSLSLDPLMLMARLGDQAGATILARWAQEAYALRAHHYN